MNQARIFQINVSEGGVPKRPLPQADVDELGITVDKQTHTKVHGGPDRALCLYSLERIQALQGEGHPIYPGSTGENITISGLDWDAVVPGGRLRLGAVVVEITSYAAPCELIVRSFADEDSGRISQKKHPGWARAYGRVRQSGTIKISDPVILEPPDEPRYE